MNVLQLVRIVGALAVCALPVLGFTNDDRFTSCEPSQKFIEIKVTSKTIPATGSAPERRVWVLSEIPGADQIVLNPSDSVLKDRIVAILEPIREAVRDAGAEVGIGRFGNELPGDPHQLELDLSDLDSVRPGLTIVLPSGLLAPPEISDVGQVHTAHICLNYTPPKPPAGVEIEIKTTAGDSSPMSGIPSLTLADAGVRFRGRPEGDIPIQLAYSSIDLGDVRRDPSITSEAAARAQLQRELLVVAASSFDAAVNRGLLNSSGAPQLDRNSGQQASDQIENDIAALYNLNRIDPKVRWGVVVPKVGVRDNSPEAPWRISVTRLQVAQVVDVEVLKSPIEMEFDGSETEKKFDAKRKKIRDQLRAKLPDFSSKPGHIVTAADIERDQELLRADKKTVKSIGDLTSGPTTQDPPPQDLIFTVSRFLEEEKVLSAKFGVGYSPEEAFTGSVALDEKNFLGFGETAKLAYSGGPQTQKIRFAFDRPFENAETLGWRVKTLGINVQYFSDDDTRFSNLTTDEIAMRETGSSATVSVAYDSFSLFDHATVDCLDKIDRKRTRIYLVATPLFSYRDVNIKDDNLLLTITGINKSLLPAARTQTSTLSVDLVAGIRRDFRKPGRSGPGVLTLSLNGRLQRGFRFFGADYEYNKVNATITTEFLFGFKSRRDILLRYNRVMGTSTHGTPIFELQRLGGPLTVRGLEEGEVVGRKLSADQFEIGINAMLLWNLITRKPVSEILSKGNCLDSDDPSAKLPFDIRNAYLKFFYDQGRIHDSDSFAVPGNSNRTARGYGAAIEIRDVGGKNINLSLGYAFSPESALHKSGAIYSGVSYSF